MVSPELKEIAEGKWELGAFTIRHGVRWKPGMAEPRSLEKFGNDIYHVYLDGKYVCRGNSMEEAQEAIARLSENLKQPAEG